MFGRLKKERQKNVFIFYLKRWHELSKIICYIWEAIFYLQKAVDPRRLGGAGFLDGRPGPLHTGRNYDPQTLPVTVPGVIGAGRLLNHMQRNPSSIIYIEKIYLLELFFYPIILFFLNLIYFF